MLREKVRTAGRKKGQSKRQPLQRNGSEGGGNRPLSSPHLSWLILGCFTFLQSRAAHRGTLVSAVLPGLQIYLSASKPECVKGTWRPARGPAEVERAWGGQPPSSNTTVCYFNARGGQKEHCQSPANWCPTKHTCACFCSAKLARAAINHQD